MLEEIAAVVGIISGLIGIITFLLHGRKAVKLKKPKEAEALKPENERSITDIVIEGAAKGKSVDELLRDTLPFKPLQGLIMEKLGDNSVETLSRAISYVEVQKIMSGKKHPKRDILLCIAFVLHMNVDETQQLLKSGRRALLTGRDPRDVVIIYGLLNHTSLIEMDALLKQRGLEPLKKEN